MMNLDNIPAGRIDRHVLLTFHAIEFAFKRAEERYGLLCDLLMEFPPGQKGSAIIAMGWDMLDWIEKLRKLMQVGTGLKKSEGWYQKFIRKMEPIGPVRGFIQHLDRELTACIKHQMPFFGILSACVAFPREKGFSIVIALPDGYKAEHLKAEDQSMCFDVRMLCTPPVDHVRMRFGTWMLNLTLLHRVIQEAHGAFITYVGTHYCESNAPKSNAV